MIIKTYHIITIDITQIINKHIQIHSHVLPKKIHSHVDCVLI